MLIGCVLRATGIGMRDPYRRQAKNVGKDVVGKRTAEIWQYGRRLSRGLADRLRRPVDPRAVEIGSRGGKALRRPHLDHRKAALAQMRADHIGDVVDPGADHKPKLQHSRGLSW